MDKKASNKILFFGGKGGVGKTTRSASFALACARKGLKTLIVSTDPAHSTADIFETPITDTITNILPNLDALEISGEKESKKYMDNVRLSLARVVSPLILEQIDRQIDAASVSPGTEEAALFDKMIEIITEKADEYDRIVFDTAPTGHTVRLLTLPDLLGAWLDTLIQKRRKAIILMSMANHNGMADKEAVEKDEVVKILRRRHDKVSQVKSIMMDQKRLSFVFVINAEKLPIDETLKAIRTLERYNIAVEGIIVNKILPDDSKDAFWRSKKEQEQVYLNQIEEVFKGKRIFTIPLMQEDMKANSLDQIASRLADYL